MYMLSDMSVESFKNDASIVYALIFSHGGSNQIDKDDKKAWVMMHALKKVNIQENTEDQSKCIKNKLELTPWSMDVKADLLLVVRISLMINENTRIIIFIVIPLQYSQT